MSRIQTISNADIWPTINANEQRRTELFDWLHANGIDHSDIPIDRPLTIEPTDKGQLIRYTVLLRNDHGRHYLADPDHPEKGAAREGRTVPLLVPLPDSWPQPVARAEPTP